MKKRYVLKDKRRFMMFVAILVLISIFIAFTQNVYSCKEPAYKIIAVKKGDTLWSIAKSNCDNNEDIRRNIYEIRKINNLTGSEIYYGSELLIPIK